MIKWSTRPGLVRELWDAGLAHRDIKRANLLVRGGRVLLGTPWSRSALAVTPSR